MRAEYKDRIVLSFKVDDKFDNLILAILEELCAKRDRGGKVKESFRKYAEEHEPEVYKRALERVESGTVKKNRVNSMVNY